VEQRDITEDMSAVRAAAATKDGDIGMPE